MATLEKLVKALEALKISKDSPLSVEDEAALRKKKKMELCSFVADTMCSPNAKNASNFASLLSFSMETLLQLCDDPDSNIRLVAEESLNRIIRAMMDNNVVKVHVELHKEIKKNGSVRSLRAALSRFSQLAHMIRPAKGKAYVQNLVPVLVEMAARKEESLLESLASSLPAIMVALGAFTTDNNIRDLLKSFLANLGSDMVVARRTAASCILTTCQHSRKPAVFFSYTLNSLVDMVVPVKSGESEDRTALGVLNCVRLLLPRLTQPETSDILPAVDRLLQVYELCLHYTLHSDHNLVTTALETLHQLLCCVPRQLTEALLAPHGLGRSRIQAVAADSEKLARRTLSELSVASADPLRSDSPLLDSQDDIIQGTRLVQGFSASSQIDSASEDSDGESGAGAGFVGFPLVLVGKPMERAPSLEADTLIGRDSPSPEAPGPPTTSLPGLEWVIGHVLERQPALLYCARRLVTGFLTPDGTTCTHVRVSARALALQCLTQLVRIQPHLFYLNVDVGHQSTSDDQQLRGLCCVFIGTFIHSALIASENAFKKWADISAKSFESERADDKTLSLECLMDLLIAGLQDESSVCVRHCLAGLSSCLGQLLVSCDSKSAVCAFPALVTLASNPYWLVKVKLLELFAELNYLHVFHVTGSTDVQNRVLHSVIFSLLGDDDNRVRKAASDAVHKVIVNLYHPIDENKRDHIDIAGIRICDSLLTGLLDRNCEKGSNQSVEGSLSRVVHSLTLWLLQSPSKHLVAGSCECLSLLSVNFPPVSYPVAWTCFLSKTTGSASGLLGLVVAMLTSSPASLDLDCHNWLLLLAGNLFSGLATYDGKNKDYSDKAEDKQLWGFFADVKLASLSEALLCHVVRLLCVFVRVLEDTPANRNPAPSPAKRKPARANSPSKAAVTQADKDVIGLNKEEKGKFGHFAHIPLYNKLFENLRSAYANYKTQLQCSEKLAGLLSSCLGCLGSLLEHCGLSESGRVAEEILQYLRTVVALEPTASVITVQQLLKSLFGCNKLTQWEDPPHRPPSPVVPPPRFSETLLLRPLSQLSNVPIQGNDFSLLNKLHRELPAQKRTVLAKGPLKGSDRQALAAHIRLFEPMVIQALKQYTVSNNVRLQVAVLSLLTRLVRLRVNYCLLDSDQIFIEFVLKQFEFMEVGQIKNAEVLIPQVFEFLAHLSYEKNHSKPVISVAKVIQLCDGLMASGQDPVTHCIPALSPIVEHVFMATGSVSAWQVKTQRDVVIAMLLRLAEYPQVLSLLSQVLCAAPSGEELKRWSQQTALTLMPLLAQGKVRLDSSEDLAALLNLLDSFLPRTLSPPDPVLRVLFTSQLYEVEYCHRSLGTMLAMLLYVCARDEEDILLARLEDLKLCVREQSDDPLNASSANLNDPPQTVFARLLLRTLHLLTSQLHAAVFSCHDDRSTAHHLKCLLVHLIICCCHMFKSSSHQQIAAGFLTLVFDSEPSTLPEISRLTLTLRSRCPLVVVLWAQMLTLIRYDDRAFWTAVLSQDSSNPISSCLNMEIVHRGSLIVYCDYVRTKQNLLEENTWLLSRHFKDLLMLSDETAITDYLEACRNNPVTCSLILPAMATVCASDPVPRLVNRILEQLVLASLDESAAVLSVLTPLLGHPLLVLARRAATLASSRVEYLLILENEEVVKLLNKEDFLYLYNAVTKNSRLASMHCGLASLLNKLATTHYGIEDQVRPLNTANIHSIALDKSWFLTQVKLRCCQAESSRQCSQLLSLLDYEDTLSVMRSQHYNNNILQHCFTIGTQLTMQERKSDTSKIEGEEVHLSALYRAARTALLQNIHHLHTLLPRMHQVYCPVGRQPFPKESKYAERLNELLGDSQFLGMVERLMPAVTGYLRSLGELGPEGKFPAEAGEDLVKFGVLCVEVVHWAMARPMRPSLVQSALECCCQVVTNNQLISLLSFAQLGSITSALATLVHIASGTPLSLPTLPGDFSVDMVRVDEENNSSFTEERKGAELNEDALSTDQEAVVSLHTCLQIAALVLWLEKQPRPPTKLPKFIMEPVRLIAKCVGRCPAVWWFSRTPPDCWPLVGPRGPLPPSMDVDLLRALIFRIKLFGWTNRTQFEETWVSLLSVLSASPGPEVSDEEKQAVMQLSSLAVQAITALLLQSLLRPRPGAPSCGRTLHSSRDKPLPLPDSWGPKLEAVVDALCWTLDGIDHGEILDRGLTFCRLHQRCNIDRLHNKHRYAYGQVSIDFLKTAVMSTEERETNPVCGDYLEHKQRLSDSGLDLRSCLQFLLDLFSQWTQPEVSVSLCLLLEVVRSTTALSDLFCERSHFAWLLDLCLELARSHPQEDEVLHQYLVVAACKAAAVLPALETEASERVLRLLEAGLKSSLSSMRLASVHGLLYLLQSFINTKEEEPSIEVISKTPDMRQRLLTIARDHISRHLTAEPTFIQTEESQLVLYSMVLYIMEQSPQELPSEVQSQLLQLVISTSSNRQLVLYNALVQGLCRLVLMRAPDLLEPVTRLAMDRLAQSDPAVSLPALKLLLTCLYSGEYSKIKGEDGNIDPEQMVATLEKLSTLFDKVKKGNVLEAECACVVLPFVLADFFPASEVLTKVIGEFLSPSQSNHRHLSAVIFQVLSQACQEAQLPLLQAWLVMSLHIFTQTLPVAMATWSLACFFISSSANPWLRAMFPHVQSRMGKCSYEDRKLLCIAASDFYRHLTDVKQKDTFIKTFREAATLSPKSPFADILSSL